jgi:hypothetical protein
LTPIIIDVEINSARTSLPTNLKKINLNRINYIQSYHKNISPGYNRKVFTELINFISSKQNTDLLHSSHCCDCKMEKLLYVFNPRAWLNDRMIEHYFTLLAKSCKDQLIDNLDPFFLKLFCNLWS